MITDGTALRAVAQSLDVDVKPSGFVAQVSAMLERIEYRRCDSGEDFEAICRLRYRAYRAHGFVPESADGITTDAYDETPNSYRFGVWLEDQLISTVRVHHMTAAEPYSSILSTFEDIIGPRLQRGETFINPTLFAADPSIVGVFPALPYVTLRLAVAANSYFDTTSCICVVREEHTAFYRRIFGAVQVGEPRAYPPFTVPVMLYDSNCAINLQKTLRRYPFFNATPAEQRLLFGKPAKGEPAPLTIIPTASVVARAA